MSTDGSLVLSRRNKDDCVICLSPVSERAICSPCNHHSFDFICLASWAQEHATCPLCKAPLTAIEYDWRAPDDYKIFHIPNASRPKQHDADLGSTANIHRRHQPRARRGYRFFGAPLRRHRISSEPASEAAIISRRRHIYRHNLFSLHVGSNRISRFKDFSPVTFTRSPELQSRARMWIRRELQVFDFISSARSSNAEFMLSYVIAILKTVDIKCSTGRAEESLGEFLGPENARLFLHELESWLRSPFTKLEDWDRKVQYSAAHPGQGGGHSG